MEKKRRLKKKEEREARRRAKESRPTAADAEQPATRPTAAKCPGLKDPLGNYSEQTGSFFG